MTHDEFYEWQSDTFCSLFHVAKTDLDDVLKVRIDQNTVIQAIAKNPEVLQHHSLKKILEGFDVLEDYVDGESKY